MGGSGVRDVPAALFFPRKHPAPTFPVHQLKSFTHSSLQEHVARMTLDQVFNEEATLEDQVRFDLNMAMQVFGPTLWGR